MKNAIILTALAVALGVSGCGNRKQEAAETNQNAVDASADRAEARRENAADSVEKERQMGARDWHADRDEYARGVRAKNDELEKEIQQLKDKAATKGDKAKADINRRIDELEVKRRNLGDKLKGLDNAAENTWQDMKSGIDEAAKDVRTGFDKMRDEFKD